MKEHESHEADKPFEIKRDARGRFLKGHSANPCGMGSENQRVIQLRNQIKKHGPEIIEKLLHMGLVEGDMIALKVLLDRIVPPLKSVSPNITIELPDGIEQNDIAGQGKVILQAAIAGKIDPDSAMTLMSGLANLTRVIEMSEVAQRLDRIEQLTTLKGESK